jgi:ABC-type Fe3+ transport system substrate-binding protein
VARLGYLSGSRRVWLIICLAAAIGCAAPAPRGAGSAQPDASSAGSTASAPAPGAGSSKAAWEQEWERAIAAARQEGKLTIAIPPGPQYEPAIREAFGKVVPGIELEMVNLLGGQFRVRAEKERAAGQYTWDVCVCGPGADTYRLAHDGVFDPIRDDLLLPEVLDDSVWLGGFETRFADESRQYAFNFGASNDTGAMVNRDLIPESELSTYDDLWKPQFRGKIVWFDPRGTGSGVNTAAIILHIYGEDRLRELWTKQDVLISNDDRQMAQWMIRGVRPITIGMVANRGIMPLQQEGVPMNVSNFRSPMALANPGAHSVQAVNRPPHPNARKVFINWLLTRDGGIAIGQAVGMNMARLDVPIYDPATEAPKGVPTLNTQSEAFADTRVKAGAIAREIFK